MEDLAQADGQLDEYLAANAAARGVAPPDSRAAAASELAETDWTVRPPIPADQPALRRIFEGPFASSWSREVLLLHPTGTGDIQGAVALTVGVDFGESVRLIL